MNFLMEIIILLKYGKIFIQLSQQRYFFEWNVEKIYSTINNQKLAISIIRLFTTITMKKKNIYRAGNFCRLFVALIFHKKLWSLWSLKMLFLNIEFGSLSNCIFFIFYVVLCRDLFIDGTAQKSLMSIL